MSLLDKKLSALLPGSRVRFTNLSGQVIEGIIAENDGKESLSVQVTSMATIRYDQIGMVDEYGQHTIVMQEPSLADNTVAVSVSAPAKATEPAAEPKPLTTEVKPLTIEIKQLKGDKESVSRAYKAMEPHEKKAFEQPYNKFQSYLQSHDETKYDEAINLIWDIIEDNEWDFNSRVNFMLAHIQLSHNEYSAASESFFYAGNYRYAYCAAYQGSEKYNGLYQLAAAFSAVYLLSGSPEEIAEASEVLRKASVISKDISGIDYVLKHTSSEEIKENLLEVLKVLGKDYVKYNTELSDAKILSERLRQFYPSDEIENKITDFLSKVPVDEKEESAEIKSSVSDTEPDITKEHNVELAAMLASRRTNLIQNPYNVSAKVFEENEVKVTNLKERVRMAVWEAQIKLVFPKIENFRADLIRKYESKISRFLPIKSSNNDVVDKATDLEIGQLYFICRSQKIIDLPEFEMLKKMRDARNTLAHWEALSYDRLTEINLI